MPRKFYNMLVTGGSGFIGANFIDFLFDQSDFTGTVVNIDKLTYAADLKNNDKARKNFSSRFSFVQADICNHTLIEQVIADYKIDSIVHFAAESHVDRSIENPSNFVDSNIIGTYVLLNCVKKFSQQISVFHYVSTDEVYGSLEEDGSFTENSPYRPNSPYAASKASSDMLVRAYYKTYGLPVTLSNCVNNFGPYQHSEKFIPVVLSSLLHQKLIPMYGTGRNVRSWIYVLDHCRGIYSVMKKARAGSQYAIGSKNECSNIVLAKKIFDILRSHVPLKHNFEHYIEFVPDRLGHDWRYSIDDTKIKSELDWSEQHDFDEELRRTVLWYLECFQSKKYSTEEAMLYA